MNERPVHIVLNPTAGGGVEESVLKNWLDEHPSARVHRTEAPGDGASLAQRAAEAGAGTVVAAGGDGTVREVVQGLVELAGDVRPRLAILPLGTANDLARTVGTGADLDAALGILDAGTPRSLDLIRCELDGVQHHCVNVVTGGFGGALHEALDDEKKAFWGPLAYLRGGVETWSTLEPYRVVLEMDEETEELSVLNIVVANGARAGWGLPVAPHADPFDGLLEVVAVQDAPALELSKITAAFLAGDPDADEHEALIHRQVRRARIRSEAEIPLSLDGEEHGARDSSYEVLPGALEILVPGDSVGS